MSKTTTQERLRWIISKQIKLVDVMGVWPIFRAKFKTLEKELSTLWVNKDLNKAIPEVGVVF